MPYSAKHKESTRARIVEAARVLFNRHGFQDVTIDMVMASAGLTRGGFYNHFKSKEALHGAAVSSFLMGRGADWRAEFDVDPANPGPEMTQRMIRGYLSAEHLGDLEGQCPMIALPSDIARANPEVKASYQQLLQAMVGLFEGGIEEPALADGMADGMADGAARETALAMAALCIGGMVIARSLPDSELAQEVRLAALVVAQKMAAG